MKTGSRMIDVGASLDDALRVTSLGAVKRRPYLRHFFSCA